jgi:hypothetical protein
MISQLALASLVGVPLLACKMLFRGTRTVTLVALLLTAVTAGNLDRYYVTLGLEPGASCWDVTTVRHWQG